MKLMYMYVYWHWEEVWRSSSNNSFFHTCNRHSVRLCVTTSRAWRVSGRVRRRRFSTRCLDPLKTLSSLQNLRYLKVTIVSGYLI